jgi:hypothetical protein
VIIATMNRAYAPVTALREDQKSVWDRLTGGMG